jgi:hypothetical protein
VQPKITMRAAEIWVGIKRTTAGRPGQAQIPPHATADGDLTTPQSRHTSTGTKHRRRTLHRDAWGRSNRVATRRRYASSRGAEPGGLQRRPKGAQDRRGCGRGHCGPSSAAGADGSRLFTSRCSGRPALFWAHQRSRAVAAAVLYLGAPDVEARHRGAGGCVACWRWDRRRAEWSRRPWISSEAEDVAPRP